MALRSLALAALLIGVATPAMAAEARQSNFGRLPDGRSVPAVTLTNNAGVSATVIAYGAALQSLVMPDRGGKLTPMEKLQLGDSDVVTFHDYNWPETFEHRVKQLAAWGRPVCAPNIWRAATDRRSTDRCRSARNTMSR